MAAGPWYTGSGLGDANQALVTKTIEVAMHTSIKNLEAIGHPVMRTILARDEGLGNLLGALGMSFSLADIGQAVAAATAEGTAVGATNFDEASVTLTPARYEFARVIGDFGRSIGQGLLRGELSPDAYALLAYEGYRVWANTLVDLILDLASTCGTEIGTTGVPLTWQVLQDGCYDLKDAGTSDSMVCFLSNKGCKDLANDALTIGGAVQMASQVQQFLETGTSGARIGRFFNGLDIYMSSSCDVDGGDTLGMIFSPQGVHTKHQQVPLPPEAMGLVNAGFYRMEMRRPGGAVSNISTDMYLAVGLRQDAATRAVRYVT